MPQPLMWVLCLAAASPLSRARQDYAASREDLSRARADAHLWKVRLDDARAEARVAQEAGDQEKQRAAQLAQEVAQQSAAVTAAQNATLATQRDEIQQAEARTQELMRRAEDEERLAAALDQQQSEKVAEPEPAQVQRALRGLVAAAARQPPSTSEAEANATVLAGEVQQADREVGVVAAETQQVELALVDAQRQGAALAQAPQYAAQAAERIARDAQNLTAFAPNRTVAKGGLAKLQQALAIPMQQPPDPSALAVLRVQLQAATETRIVDEKERQAHLATVKKLEAQLQQLSSASSALAGELQQPH